MTIDPRRHNRARPPGYVAPLNSHEEWLDELRYGRPPIDWVYVGLTLLTGAAGVALAVAAWVWYG